LLADEVEEFAVFFGQGGVLEEIGSVQEGLAELLLTAPEANLVVIAVEEDLRDAHSCKFGGAGEVRVVQEATGPVLGAGNALGI